MNWITISFWFFSLISYLIYENQLTFLLNGFTNPFSVFGLILYDFDFFFLMILFGCFIWFATIFAFLIRYNSIKLYFHLVFRSLSFSLFFVLIIILDPFIFIVSNFFSSHTIYLFIQFFFGLFVCVHFEISKLSLEFVFPFHPLFLSLSHTHIYTFKKENYGQFPYTL